MECRIARPDEIAAISKQSLSLGNVAFDPDKSIVAVLIHSTTNECEGFAAVNSAYIAAGSWIDEVYRGRKLSYEMRACLDNELRRRGVTTYIAVPNKTSEYVLFAKYGSVTDHMAQVRHL